MSKATESFNQKNSSNEDPFWFVNCPVVSKSDWNILKESLSIFHQDHIELLIPFVTDEEKQMGIWTGRFCTIEQKDNKISKFKEEDFHIIYKYQLDYWLYALTNLRNPYSHGFYDEFLKDLSQLLVDMDSEQVNIAPSYVCSMFNMLYRTMELIVNREQQYERSLYDEQFFPGISPLLHFLTECIPILQKLPDPDFLHLGKQIKIIYSIAKIELPIQFQWNLQAHVVYHRNRQTMEELLRTNPHSDHLSIFHYCLHELHFPFAIFQAIEEQWIYFNKISELDKRVNDFVPSFNDALIRRLSIIPALPYLLTNSFSEILPRIKPIDSSNEVLKLILNWSRSPFPKDKILGTKNRTELFMAAVVSRLTREHGPNYHNDDDERKIFQKANTVPTAFLNWFPKERCKHEMELYVRRHNINAPSFLISYYPIDISYEFFWDYSEKNSDWFYNIFFNFLVPKDDKPNYQQGELFFLLFNFLYGRTDVREKFPKYEKETFEYFCKTVDSLMEIGSLLIYYMKLKEFMPTYSKKMEDRIKERLDIERLFIEFFTSSKELEITGKLKGATKKLPFVFFYSFMKTFVVYSYYKKGSLGPLDEDKQRLCLQRFENVLEYLSDLRGAWITGNIYCSVYEVKPNLLHKINALCSGDWHKVMMLPSLKKLRFEKFEYSTLTKIRPIGKGGQAKAYCVECPNFVFPVVAKIWSKHELSNQLIAEIRALLTVQSNPHIVTIHGYIVEGIQTRGILMEYCEGGSLKEVIKSSKIYSQADIVLWVTQAACGLSFLHSNGIAHRDVNPANMLLDVSYKNLKISDLGTAKISLFKKLEKEENSLFPQTAYRGTPGYKAPEILDIKIINYTTRVDVFSLGRSMWNMIYRCDPDKFFLKNPVESSKFFKTIKHQKVEVSDDVWKFSNRMMAQRSNDRPPMEEVFTFFSKLKSESVTLRQIDVSTQTTETSKSLILPEILEFLSRVESQTSSSDEKLEEACVLLRSIVNSHLENFDRCTSELR